MARAILRTKVRIVKDDDRQYRKIVKAVQEEKAGAVYIGILEEESSGTGRGIGLAGIATVHEFGAVAKGTAFGDIVIPQRSFVRSTMDEEREKIAQLSERLWKLVIDLKISKFEALSRMGIFIQAAIQKKIATIKDPRNADATIAIKGFDNPLIGPTPSVMQKAINFVVREK